MVWIYKAMYPWTAESALAILPHKEFSITEDLYETWNFNGYGFPYIWNYAIWGAFGFLLVCGILQQHIIPRLPGKAPKSIQGIRTFFAKHFYYASLVGSASARPVSYIFARGELGRWTSIQIPTRVHGLIASIFVATTIAFCFSCYEVTYPNMYFPVLGYPFQQYLRHFSDRTGFMSFVLTPLTYILAGRNSPVIWMTGISYSDLQIHHRWVARMAFLTAFFHTIGYSGLEAFYGADYFYKQFAEAYWNWGWVATMGGFFCCILSLRRIRELCYEVFLVIHITCAILWLVGCYYHVYLLDPEYMFLKFLYATIAFWAFDRFVRGAISAYYHVPKLGGKRSDPQTAAFAAEGYLIGSGSYIRLRINPVRALPARLAGPGSYVFIRSLDKHFLESHPFTIAFPAGVPASTSESSTPGSEGEAKKEALDGQIMHAFDHSLSGSNTEFELILKSYSGYTKTLAKHLSDISGSNVDGSAHPVKTVKLIVEGPYGNSTSLDHYDSTVLVAGGSGISAMTAHIADMAKGAVAGSLKVQRITLVWAVRDIHAVNVLIPYLVRLRHCFAKCPAGFLNVHIYYTGETLASSSSSDAEKSNADTSSSLSKITELCKPAISFATVSVHAGRPSVGSFIDEAVSEGGKVAVVSCGPESLCDTTRNAVRARLGPVSSTDLVYHEESFTW